MSIQPQRAFSPAPGGASGNLADILERVLDKGVVIAGDIVINLLDIELLTVKLRLLIASVDTARELGIDWWQHDPWLSSRAEPSLPPGRDRQSIEDDGAAGGASPGEVERGRENGSSAQARQRG